MHGPEISEREAEVLGLLAQRLSNAQIAHRLHISVRTVEAHVSALLRKMGAADRRALAALAGQGTPQPADAGVTGLPVSRTSFVGRGREHGELCALLDRPGLVTVTGTGGVGKTRLAAAAAATFTGGGAFVELVRVADGYATQAVLAALGGAVADQSVEDTLINRLRDTRSLLVLDNCEHLLDSVARLVDGVLSQCAAVTVLATSRERLGLPGERVLPLRPLPLESDAERLFLDRAATVDPGFTAEPAAVTDLCARLDGLPLAIELAAARSASLGMPGLLAALDDNLRLLSGTRSADTRHRSLRAVLDWSYHLLDADEQSLLRRLGIFAGTFDLPSAVAVTGAGSAAGVADLIGRLADKSLLVHERHAGRWRLLETVRAYAADLLDAAGERPSAADRHLRWAVDAAAWLERDTAAGRQGRLDAVVDDLRAALAAADGSDDRGHRLARSLGRLALRSHFPEEAAAHFRRAAQLARVPGQAARDLRDALEFSMLSTRSGASAWDMLLEAAEQARLSGDSTTRAVALAYAVYTAASSPTVLAEPVPVETLRARYEEAVAAGDPGDPTVAAHLALTAAWLPEPGRGTADLALSRAAVDAARAAGDVLLTSYAVSAVANAYEEVGRHRDAYAQSRGNAADLFRAGPEDPLIAGQLMQVVASGVMQAVVVGDLSGALELADELCRHGDDRSHYTSAHVMTPLALAGRFTDADERAEMMWASWQRAGRPVAGWIAPPTFVVALTRTLRGDHDGCRLWRDRVFEAAGPANAATVRRLPSLAFLQARAALHTGDLDAAPALVKRLPGSLPGSRWWPYAVAACAELATVAELPEAGNLLAQADALAGQSDWVAAVTARTRGRRTGDPRALEEAAALWERVGSRWERACTLLLLPERAAEASAELAKLGVRFDG